MKTFGVLGATGSAGYWALRYFGSRPQNVRVLAGVRSLSKVDETLKKACAGAEWHAVDACDAPALARFADACDAVVNLVGPSSAYSRLVADACAPRTRLLVDGGHCMPAPGGREQGRAACIYEAGALPGLSALLCRYLADHFESVGVLLSVSVLSGVFSPGAARDYLDGVIQSRMAGGAAAPSGARAGAGRPDGLPAQRRMLLPFCREALTLTAYTDSETASVERAVRPRRADFYVGMGAEAMRKSLEMAGALFAAEPEQAVELLVEGSRCHVPAGGAQMLYLIQMDGRLKNGTDGVRTLVLKACNPAAVTGSTAAAAADVLLEAGGLAAGFRPLGQIQDARGVVEQVAGLDAVEHFDVYTAAIESLAAIEEGAI